MVLGYIYFNQGRFEILSFMGSFMKYVYKRSFMGISIGLEGPGGRVFGGGLAGLSLATGPIQVG